MSIDAAPAAAPPDDVDPDLAEPGDDLAPPAAPEDPDDGGGRPQRTLRHRLRLPLLASLVVQLVLLVGERLPSVDGTAYFEAGRNLLDGRGFTRHGAPELHFPPLTPICVGLLEKLTGSELASLRIWNLLTAALVVALVILLAHRIWRDDATTVVAAWLGGTMAGLTPLFSRQGGGSESIAVAMLLLGVLLAVEGLGGRRAGWARTAFLAGSGLAVGLAYLARPESMLPGFFIGLGLVVEALRRSGSIAERLRRVLLWAVPFGLAFLLCFFPYLAYLHGHTGKWSPTAKSQDASIQAWRAVAENNRLERDRVLYAVNSSGTGLGVETRPLTALAKEDPRGWFGIVRVNVRTLLDLYVLPAFSFGPSWRLIPGFLLVPALVQLWRDRRRRSAQVLTLMALAPVATCVIFFTLPRYLVVTTAVLTLFAARGVAETLRRWSPRAGRILLAATVLFMATSTVGELKPFLPWSTTNDPVEQAAAGRWIEDNTPTDARIMTRSFHVQAYARRDVVAMPSTDYATMLKFARRMGVSYVVADEATISRRRPELFAALMTSWPPPGLRLVETITRRGQEVRIYELDPQPPRSDRKPIPLGYVSD